MAIFTAATLALKLSIVRTDDLSIIIPAAILDVMTLILNMRSEASERELFHSLYKAQKATTKFKNLINDYFPNPMGIFSKDTLKPQYSNRAFRKTFKCPTISQSLERLTIEKEEIRKQSSLFENLGIVYTDDIEGLNFSKFLALLSQNIHLVRNKESISISIVTDDYNEIKMNPYQGRSPTINEREANNKASLDSARQSFSIGKSESPTFKKKLNWKKKFLYFSTQSKSTDKEVKLEINDLNLHHENYDRDSEKAHTGEFLDDESKRRVFQVKIFLLLWDDAESLALIFDDTTKQKIISNLKAADKNKDLVIATVSHELRTPLNGMLGLIDIIKDKSSNQEILPYLNACKNSGLLLLNLVNSTLDLSQIKNNKLTLVYTKVSIFKLLNELKSLFEYSCALKSLYLNIEVDSNVPGTIVTDKNRLSQILINLIGNAFKFTFEGGITIRVSLVESNPTRLRFYVQDTGMGIQQNDQKKLFQLFGKLEQQDKSINTNGVGLGLTISTTLAILLGPSLDGGIKLESELKKGSIFHFTIESRNMECPEKTESAMSTHEMDSCDFDEHNDFVVLKKMSTYMALNTDNYSKLTTSFPHLRINDRDPYDQMDKKASSPIPASQEYLQKTVNEEQQDDVIIQNGFCILDEKSGFHFERPWCFIVDDNPFNLMVARHVMERKRYQVKTASNGKEAIQKIKEHFEKRKKLKVILMDCQMSVMDGYEATQILKEMMKTGEIPNCPIIALTSNNRDEEHEKMWKEAQMNGCLAKPLKEDELDSLLKKIRRNKLKETV